MANEVSFKDLTAPAFNEPLQAHNALSFKLVKTGTPIYRRVSLFVSTSTFPDFACFPESVAQLNDELFKAFAVLRLDAE